MASNRKTNKPSIGWTGVAGLVLSVLLLWWTLHDVEFSELAAHMRAARAVPFIACVLVATLVFPIRTVRWRYLLRLHGEKLPFVPLWHATAIGFMANNLLPARAGEIARAYAAGRLTGVRFSAALASLVVERAMDGMTLVALLGTAILLGGLSAGTEVAGVTFRQTLTGFTALFVALMAVAVWAVHWPGPALRIGGWLVDSLLPARWSAKAKLALEGLFEGLDVLADWRRFGLVALWSLAVWGTNGLSFWLCMIAFGLNVPWTAALVLQSLIGFGVAAPSAPGFFGVFEAVTRATLTLYAVPASLAVSYAFGYHLFTFVPITLLGLWSLSRAHLHLADLESADDANG